MIVDLSLKNRMIVEDLRRKNIELRFWGENIFESEVAVYGSTVIMTTYDDKLISIVIKNPSIAATLRAIFDSAWEMTNSQKSSN